LHQTLKFASASLLHGTGVEKILGERHFATVCVRPATIGRVQRLVAIKLWIFPNFRRFTHTNSCKMPLAKDLLNPSPMEERRRCKLKRLVQSPNSFFMDVKCPGCYKITTVFSHAQTVVLCVGCSSMLCQPTGGKAKLTDGCSFRRKQH